MAKIEHGEGRLISVDTENKTLRIQEISMVASVASLEEEEPPAKEWEHPYALEWQDRLFFDFVGKPVEYVLSDGAAVSLTLAR